MKNVLLLRFGEVFLKGKNKSYFINLILKNIKHSLRNYKFCLKNIQGRFLLADYEQDLEDEIIDKVSKVFGLYSFSKCIEIESKQDVILDFLKTIDLQGKSFKVDVNRADKSFPVHSMDFNAICGGAILETNANSKVEMRKPEVLVNIDIRQNGKTYIYYESVLLGGGLPVGSGGKCLVLISGGIDSPVASYLIAKRGMNVNFLHFHSYPYTSVQAQDKVYKLIDMIKDYTGDGKVFVANLKTLQEEINANCNNDYIIAVMRRVMMSVAYKIAKENGYDAIITGENLGQVASQTIQSLTLTNLKANEIPVLRPLITMDKIEIIEIAKRIGTYKTSIEPFEDCCTVFLPKNPIIKPTLANILKEENKLNIEALTKEILDKMEIK